MTRLLEKEPSDPSHSFWSNRKSRVFRLTRSDENRQLACRLPLELANCHSFWPAHYRKLGASPKFDGSDAFPWILDPATRDNAAAWSDRMMSFASAVDTLLAPSNGEGLQNWRRTTADKPMVLAAAILAGDRA